MLGGRAGRAGEAAEEGLLVPWGVGGLRSPLLHRRVLKAKDPAMVGRREDEVDLVEQWRDCPNCKQEYQNELLVDLATELVHFVQKTYPVDKEMQLEAFATKLDALQLMADRIQPKQKKEAKQVANKMLSMIRRVNAQDISQLQNMQEVEEMMQRVSLLPNVMLPLQRMILKEAVLKTLMNC